MTTLTRRSLGFAVYDLPTGEPIPASDALCERALLTFRSDGGVDGGFLGMDFSYDGSEMNETPQL